MDLQTLQTFLGWCVILNFGLLFYTFAVCVFATDFVHRLHSRWFPMSKEAFSAFMYGFIGFYKIIVLVFNLIPYVVVAYLL